MGGTTLEKVLLGVRISKGIKDEFKELCKQYNLPQGKTIEVLIKEFIKLIEEIK